MTISSTTLPLSILETLRVLHARLAEAPFPWAITGSVGMALQGMPLAPRDIDLQTDRAGAYAMQDLLAEFVVQPVAMKDSGHTRSLFGVLRVEGVTVEIMGDMVRRGPDGEWGTPPALAAITRRVMLAGMDLPVLDLAHEYQAYLAMGRTERAEEIRRWLERGEEPHPPAPSP